ncbi:aldehyde dehydrogenase family protein [Peredibacter starrii]|uniref:Aldehyde dehydrogenase family protein n=1 Tax=Peredibacter starrii TaxID=28202 RepID=A0AAX4HRY5_9BACT|nr:aldehyde dehydrogenase family protein [Peredibacter starrii]WPU66094.1 aldehyde dehydrogenase family protein [Peredibacter starrii]
MQMTLKGDYFNGRFHQSSNAQEKILKRGPADLTQVLWEAGVYYDHIEPVIESAQKGFATWRKTSFEERIAFLKKYQEAVRARKDEISMALALEVGKPLWEAKTEAAALDSKVTVTITDSLERIKRETIKEVMPKIDGHTVYKPLGPCFVIGPFNFPCHLANGQILAALLAGNSVIFKPSEKTIYSAQLMMECFHAAGFPEGVINFINGTGHTAGKLTGDQRIRGVFFTGSKGVGQRIVENTYKDLSKLVALELGGKNSTIIHHDTNISHALPELLRACFLTSGQRCTSTSMILVHKKIEQEFISQFKAVTERIRVGHPTSQPDPFMGPLIDEHAEKLYFDFCNFGKQEGAEEIVSPRKLDVGFQGYYVSPSIHYAKKPNLEGKFIQEEIFGPNCFFVPYEDIEEAIHIANCTQYGLAASVYTRDADIYNLCLRDIDAGLINLNRSTVGATARLPFGGVKNSGNHHPAAVSMIDHCVSTVASLETLDDTSSKLSEVVGLKD